MSNQKLTVVANILAKTEKRELVKSELLKLIDITRSEEGCINYDLHQDNENPDLFLSLKTGQIEICGKSIWAMYI